MSNLTLLKEQIEEIRRQLDDASLRSMDDETFYNLSIQMDKMIEEYLEFQIKSES